ncbi:PEP-CTERM sorting domain-containing protein [Desulfatitalea alkaliphila]|uniref:PEP-CTERM sorting domain-containing protein n=1 Tax=Desulfatitalea alkaliphila TaxID=2929485 RepID=A0AA41R8M0_9BACT|nr:PEP-CTERM sorting domain-containing protein [Desulfatitalea alkaliphila]MCJ8503006.1 PEP-CTERM sorting domain-containing protein [Desulfatitalea alkaliphila]
MKYLIAMCAFLIVLICPSAYGAPNLYDASSSFYLDGQQFTIDGFVIIDDQLLYWNPRTPAQQPVDELHPPAVHIYRAYGFSIPAFSLSIKSASEDIDYSIWGYDGYLYVEYFYSDSAWGNLDRQYSFKGSGGDWDVWYGGLFDFFSFDMDPYDWSAGLIELPPIIRLGHELYGWPQDPLPGLFQSIDYIWLTAQVPEPSTLLLVVLGLICIGGLQKLSKIIQYST